MESKFYKYAYLLLTKGLYIKENQPLLINAPIDAIDFVRVLTKVACELNIRDIYYDWTDEEIKHTAYSIFLKKISKIVDFGINLFMMNMQKKMPHS